jgi:hypothetical protein
MQGGMCKFCTYHFSLKFAFLGAIVKLSLRLYVPSISALYTFSTFYTAKVLTMS